MQKLFTTTFLFILFVSASSQTTQVAEVSSIGGAIGSTGDISFAFTCGEPCVSTANITSTCSSVGFLNNEENFCEVNIEELNFGEWKIYPNPTNGSVNFEVSTISEPNSIRIFDSTGRVVYYVSSEVRNTFNIDLSAIPVGHYYVCISNSKKTSVHKLSILGN